MKTFFNSLDKTKVLNNETSFAVLVSGGVDSIVLLFLINIWAKKNNKEIIVIHFNHNLRKNSMKDFLFVKAFCTQCKLKCVLLNWKEKPTSAILEKARISRYEAISYYCKNNNINTCFTGHHADDIAETITMRLLRQSNIDGLCPIMFQRKLFGIKLIRPLLKVRKKELYKFAKEKKIKFIEDPSNKNTKTLRARIRNYLNKEEKLSKNLIKSAELFCKLKFITDNYIRINFSRYYDFFETGYVSVDKEILNIYPKFMLLKFLKICLMKVGNKIYPPQTIALEKVYDLINSKQETNITISGCVVSCKKSKLLIIREYNNIDKNLIKISENKELEWDNRFIIRNISKSKQLLVFPLGNLIFKKNIKYPYNIIKKSFNKLPYMVKISLPVIKNLEGSIFVPHLNIYSNLEIKKITSVKTKLLY